MANEKFFTVDAQSIISWGQESIKDSTTAVLELVKNSYDADATIVKVEIIQNNETPYIRITDNGTGMSENDFDQSWLRIGYSQKRDQKFSALNRRKTGEKGIGRISADRLGAILEVRTRTNEGQTFGLRVNWDNFKKKGKAVNEISLPIIDSSFIRIPIKSGDVLNYLENGATQKASGTELYITKLREGWSVSEILNLRDELSTLLSPFNQNSNFEIYLFTDTKGIENGKIDSELYPNPVIALSAKYRTNSNDVLYLTKMQNENKPTINILPLNQVVTETSKSERESDKQVGKLSCGDVKIKLLLYVLRPTPLENIEVNVARTRKFLQNQAGIKIYRDNIRVKPYGNLDEPGGDWLNIGKRKASNPAGAARKGFRVSPNQIVGVALLSRDKNSNLLDSASREGLIHSDAYKDLQKIALGCLSLLENKYHNAFSQQKEQTASKNPVQSVKNINKSFSAFLKESKGIAQMLAKSSEEKLLNLQTIVEELQIEINKTLPTLKSLQEQNVIYRGLATVGISAAVFGHETEFLIANLTNSAELIKANLELNPPNTEEAMIECNEIISSADNIGSWGAFALSRVKRDKRRSKRQDVKDIVENLLNSVKPVFTAVDIRIERHLESISGTIFAMDIETVLLNLLTNAYHACLQKKANERAIRITLKNKELDRVKGFELVVADSGHGVAKEFQERIWEPLFTTKDKERKGRTGTGLGLSIVNSIVVDTEGKRFYEKDEFLKGAKFTIWLPIRN